MTHFKICDRLIGQDHPTYFIADIAANHDGDLEKAIALIYSSADAGADAVKFQNFRAETIVSDYGFKSLDTQLSHQKNWKKSVFDVYKDASLPMEWTETLQETCKKAGVHYFTSPYDMQIVDKVSPYVDAWKIGSGDVTWHDIIAKIAQKDKPIILASGACSIEDVTNAVKVAQSYTKKIGLLQCNTNYTANSNETRAESLSRMASINLKVLQTYQKLFPDIVTGLSDHTLGHTTVMGAVGLFDGRIVEKHYTLDNNLEGPDHAFSMCPKTWRDMIDATRHVESIIKQDMDFQTRMDIIKPYVDVEALKASLGDGVKRIEGNEKDTYVVQRRAICAYKKLSAGHVICENDLFPLRPQLPNSFLPYETDALIGKTLKTDKEFGEAILQGDF